MAKKRDPGKKTKPEKPKEALTKTTRYDEAVQRDLDRLSNRGPALSHEEIQRIYGDQTKNGK